MKALLISIAVLMSADAALNHGAVTKSVFHSIGGFFSATGHVFSDSIFSQ